MLVQFIPQSVDRISPTIRAAEAIDRLAGFDRVQDAQVYANKETGELHIVAPPMERMHRWAAASEVLFEAVRSAALSSYIWSPVQGLYLSVPRFYWNRLSPFDLHKAFAGAADIGGGDATLDGQEVVLSAAELEKLLDSLLAEVEARLSAPIAPEADEKPSRQTRPKPGWYDLLRSEFIKEVEKREEWPVKHPNDLPPRFPTAAAFRRRLLNRKGWPPNKKLPRQTVEYHYNDLRAEFKI